MVLLGDVTGMGVAAAALTSLVRHTARTAAAFDPRPAAVLRHVNARAAPAPADRAGDDGLRVAAPGAASRSRSAATRSPLLRRAAGSCEKVGATGLLLGAVDAYEEAEEVTIELAPGDTLLIYTDGVTDTPGVDSRFGDERLRAAVDAAPAEPAAAAADRVAGARRVRARDRSGRPRDARLHRT